MEKKRKESYFDKLGDTFKKAKIDRRYWKILLIDLVFALVTALIIGIILYITLPIVKSGLENSGTFFGQEINFQDPVQVVSLLTPVIPVLLIAGLVFFVIWFFLGSIFKGWIWRTIFNKKMNFSFFLKYTGFRLLFGISVFVLLVLMAFLPNLPLIVILLLGIFLLTHLFFVSFVYVARDSIVWKSIKSGFRKGIRIHLFLLPYLFLVCALILRQIIKIAFGLIPGVSQAAPQNLLQIIVDFMPYLKAMLPSMIFSMIVGLFFSAYIRIWYAEFVNKI